MEFPTRRFNASAPAAVGLPLRGLFRAVTTLLFVVGWIQVEATDPRTQIPRQTDHWLKLETERRDYQRNTPANGVKAASERERRLRTQRQQDHELLSRQQQSSGVQRQKRQANPQATGHHARPLRNPVLDRALPSQQLHNRMQRRSWRY